MKARSGQLLEPARPRRRHRATILTDPELRPRWEAEARRHARPDQGHAPARWSRRSRPVDPRRLVGDRRAARDVRAPRPRPPSRSRAFATSTRSTSSAAAGSTSRASRSRTSNRSRTPSARCSPRADQSARARRSGPCPPVQSADSRTCRRALHARVPGLSLAVGPSRPVRPCAVWASATDRPRTPRADEPSKAAISTPARARGARRQRDWRARRLAAPAEADRHEPRPVRRRAPAS